MTQDDNAKKDADNRPLAEFEQSLTELEALVENLETGDAGLEESLEKFERGVALARNCQTALKTAELRIRQLLENGDNAEIADFDDGERE